MSLCNYRSRLAVLLLELLISVYIVIQCAIIRCDSQSTSHNNQHQQLQYALQLHKQLSTNLTHQKTNLPLERLNLLNNRTLGNLRSSPARIEHLTESPSEWLLMGGGGSDLLPEEARSSASFADSNGQLLKSSRKSGSKRQKESKTGMNSQNKTMFDDDSQQDSSESNEVFDEVEGDIPALAGTTKAPDCAGSGRYYCTFKEEYPLKLVTEVTKYYKWPLEKLFRDLHAQIMPKLAQDTTGNLVCDSITRVVRPGWSRNTNDKWLVVINTENYHQYVTEVVCQYGSNSRCNFIPPCYYSSCQQRYNTQKLLVIDPTNPYRGPFLSEFLFPSCCVCYVPTAKDTFQDKYRPSPATIYQRTLQQESSNNLYPPKFRPGGILEDPSISSSTLADQPAASSISSSSSSTSVLDSDNSLKLTANQVIGPGEIRRAGELQLSTKGRHQEESSNEMGGEFVDFPRVGLGDSLVAPDKSLPVERGQQQ